jgi:hypothetical protein
MLNDEFDEFLPFLVQVINPSTLFMLNNIMHQKVQGVHQTPRPKDVRMHPLNDFSHSLTISCMINNYLNHIRQTNAINNF